MTYKTAAAMQGESLRKGPWHEGEDERLITFVKLLGSRRWDYVARVSGLRRSGKSCRLRWLNYLRPNIKHGHISAEEEKIILQLHERWGNKWSIIAGRLPGRTDNEIKNYWRTHLRKKTLIQEHNENFQFGGDHGNQLFLFQGDGSSAQTYNGESYKPCENISETGNSSYDAVVLSDYTITSSPYQTRLSDWISEFPDDQSEIKSEEGSNGMDSCYCHPAWISEENDLWGCSVSLWNME